MEGKTRRFLLLALLVMGPSVVPAVAGSLAFIDPVFAPVRASVLAAPARVTIPRSALADTYLFRVVVEATDTPRLTLGSSTETVAVALKFSGGVMTVQPVGAPEAAPLLTYPARPSADGIEVDASLAPGVKIDELTLVAAHSGPPLGITQAPGLLSWAQQMTLSATATATAPVTVGVRYWLTRAPDGQYEPRPYPVADRHRVGLFAESTAGTVANRWRTRGGLKVVIHPSFPEAFRAGVREAALSWNRALFAATGAAPIVVETGNQALLPGTPGVLVLYYFAGNPGGDMDGTEGLAPIAVDPRTGEIVSAHVLINGGVILDGSEERSEDSATGHVVTEPHHVNLELVMPGGSCLPVKAMRRCRRARKLSSGIRKDPQLIRETVIHEVGHALGLRHNFKASADVTRYRPGEASTSVMDYLLDLTTPPSPGPYDEAAIRYGYGNATVDVMKDLFYGTDEDQGLDPDVNQFDAGDPLQFYLDQVRLMRRSDEVELADFTRGFTNVLVHLRRFVNNSVPVRSERAFQALMACLKMSSQDPRSLAQREAAALVLTRPAPEKPQEPDAEEPPPYAPLTPAQQQQVEATLPRIPDQ
jgi:hypothetical protein